MKILVADDAMICRFMVESNLQKWGHEVVVAADGLTARAILDAPDAPSLAVVDWMMPGLDGIDLIREFRKRTDRYVYFLLLTAKGKQEHLLKGLEAGADDYLSKPFDLAEFRARLGTGIRIVELQRQLLEAQEVLRHQATHDALTGLKNRSAIFAQAEEELARAKRKGTSVGIIMADIDHFKQINDTHGHPAGDAVLRHVAGTISKTVRAYDGVGRYGGEEFLLVLPECDVIQAGELAERIRSCVAAESIPLGNQSIHATLSLGVTACKSPDSGALAAVLHQADEALYQAKRGGRNRCVLAVESPEQSIPKEMPALVGH